MKQVLLLIYLVSCTTIGLMAQTVSGTITDENGDALIGASVVEIGTENATITDTNGSYVLTLTTDNPSISYSYTGYQTEKVAVDGLSTINVVLSAGAMLDEIVVTGLGIEREKSSLGYTTTQIKGEDFAVSMAPNLANALSGKAPGVFITNPNSVEGGSTRITIRGNTSLSGGNSPLIVVDGIPFDNSSEAVQTTANRDFGSALNQIEALDIEQMDILKGTAATALYGSRGANGVILITTKKGEGVPGMKVAYTFNTKISDPHRFQEFQNEYGFGGPAWALWQKPVLGDKHPDIWGQNHTAVPVVNSQGNNLMTWDYSLFSWFGTNSSWGPRFNNKMITWWDGEQRPWSAQPDNMELFYKTGQTTTHNLSLSNSGSFGNYRASITRKNNDGIIDIDKNGFKTTNILVGGNLKFAEKLRADIFANFNRKEYENPPLLGQSNDAFTNIFYNLPRSYKALEWKDYKNPDGSRKNFNGWGYWINKNIGWDFHENNYQQLRNQMRSSIKLNYDPLDWFSISGSAGIDFANDERETKNGFTDGVGLVGGRYEHGLERHYAPNLDFLARVFKDNLIEKVNGSFSFGGQSWQSSSYSIRGNNSRTAKSPYIYAFNNYDDAPSVSDALPKEEKFEKKINSLFGILDLSYSDYLFLQVTGRNDWSSTLPSSNNDYFYPGASLSFIPSRVFDLGNAISYAKLRLAYAETGSDTDPYEVNPTFQPGSFGGRPTVSIKDDLPNLDLRSQRSREVEIGTQLSFFNNKLNLDFTGYNKRSFNQILSAPLPWSSGAKSIKFNTGELELKGFEFDVNMQVLESSDLDWRVGVVGSKFSNKLLALTEGVNQYHIGDLWGSFGTAMRATVGQNFGAIYGWGIKKAPNGRPILNVFKDKDGNVTGTLYAKSDELEIVGNATPDLMGGLNSLLSWKNFSLFTLVDFKIGGDVYSPQYGSALIGGLSPATLKERNGGGLPYTYPNGDTENIGVIMDGVVLVDGTTDQYVENTHVVHAYYKYAGNGWNPNPQPDAVFENSWGKLRELSLTYQVPDNAIKGLRYIRGANLGLTGRDLFYIFDTMPDKINPEGLNGVGDAAYVIAGALPGIRSVAFNLNVTF